MAIPINIEDLLNKRKIESNRIEFKKGWNPDKIYRTICAFANDFDNIGGGYIVVGIEEEERTGIAKRPVTGVPIEALNDIQKDMVGYNNKIEPYYMPRIDVQEVDGKSVLVIWAPAGVNRPYNVRERVTAKQSPGKWYIRSGTSTIEAKGEVLDELREMANRTPFDERGNERIDISDISPALVLDYLQTVGSRLANDFESKPFVEILAQMDLLTGPTEHQTLKNVAAMMFCKNPAKFFPTTQVDIVIFPEGCIENPNNMIEVPKIIGPVPEMIKQTLDYIRTNVIKKRIIKPKDKAESITFFNYPYQAIEEGYMNGHKFDIERFIKDKYHIIIKREELASDISGKLKMEDGVWVMTVNSQHPVVRQRYTLGHELGHYLNHRDSKKSFEDSVFFRSSQKSSMEYMADQFAARLLMPESDINTLLKNGVKTVKEMASEFDVSLEAMKYRLEQLGYGVKKNN